MNEELQSPLAPTTTAEQDLRTAGQRSLNRIWEMTQAGIAIGVVSANLLYVFVSPFLPAVTNSNSELLKNAFFLVLGFYFGRTNHARIGDIPKARGMDDR